MFNFIKCGTISTELALLEKQEPIDLQDTGLLQTFIVLKVQYLWHTLK